MLNGGEDLTLKSRYESDLWLQAHQRDATFEDRSQTARTMLQKRVAQRQATRCTATKEGRANFYP